MTSISAVDRLQLEARVLKAEAALAKISAIRDDIIKTQRLGWSSHVYPLVAALTEAGVEGQPYAELLGKQKVE